MKLKRTDVYSIISVVAILALLGTVALARQPHRRAQAKRMECVNQLKQIGLSFRIFANDCGDVYPTMVPDALGGAQDAAELGEIWKVFQVMSNELSVPATVRCPADTRTNAVDWASLENGNVSYFVGLDARDTTPNMLLAGDHNLTLDGRLLSWIVPVRTNSVAWSENELHRGEGNVGLADGSVQPFTSEQLRKLLVVTGDPTNRLAFP
jgi:hypothetical protein